MGDKPGMRMKSSRVARIKLKITNNPLTITNMTVNFIHLTVEGVNLVFSLVISLFRLVKLMKNFLSITIFQTVTVTEKRTTMHRTPRSPKSKKKADMFLFYQIWLPRLVTTRTVREWVRGFIFDGRMEECFSLGVV